MIPFLSLKGKVWSGYILAFLLLLVSYALIFYTMRRSINETNSVSRTFFVINKLEALKGEVTEAETGVRGYVITKDSRFLEPYYAAIDSIPITYTQIRKLLGETNAQHKRLDTLISLINEKLGYMSNGLTLFQANNLVISDNMRIAREPSKRAMDNIRVLVTKMAVDEERLMELRKSKLTGFFDSTQLIAIVSLIIAFITLFYSVAIFNNENKAKERAIEKAMQYSMKLEDNISELENTNIELQEFKNLEKFTATGRIARTIAHEVRNPLTNISLAAEQLLEVTPPTKESGVLLEMITRNTTRINQLVSELLNATRFAHLEFEKRELDSVMDETLEMAEDRIQLSHIRVEKTYSQESCEVMVDTEKIKLALLNIIVNAIEAMEKDKGVLIIKTRKQGTKCFIEIRDNGRGMEEDVLQNLFEPYFTGKQTGNGLGLTNTQNIIFNHKGSIKVYSKPGQGATFIIALNLAESV